MAEFLQASMSKLKEMVDVNTVVGEPITTPDGETLVPVSRVSFGFGHGGGDLVKQRSGFAGGGTGAVGSQSVTLENSGKLRIAYQQGAGNSVTCVSSVDQLNRFGLYGSDKLAAYDKHFFDSKALVLVKYTVSSGSTQLSLSSATRVSNMVSVHVDAQSAGMGTSDMATWLLWAEVDKSLSDCQWVLDGASGAGSGVTK